MNFQQVSQKPVVSEETGLSPVSSGSNQTLGLPSTSSNQQPILQTETTSMLAPQSAATVAAGLPPTPSTMAPRPPLMSSGQPPVVPSQLGMATSGQTLIPAGQPQLTPGAPSTTVSQPMAPGQHPLLRPPQAPVVPPPPYPQSKRDRLKKKLN